MATRTMEDREALSLGCCMILFYYHRFAAFWTFA